MRKRNYKPNIVGELIKAKMKAIGKENDYLEAIVKNHWEEIAGSVVFNQTLNIYFHKGILYVKINSAILKSELLKLKDQFKQKINTYVRTNFVNSVVFY